MALELYLVRHGQTDFSRENRFCGAIDPPLNAVGQRMAEALAAAHATGHWTAIYVSPYQRAQSTVAPLARKAGIEPIVEPGLAEISYGEWEGMAHDEVKARLPEAYAYWSEDPASRGTPGGETAFQVAARATPVIGRIRERHTDGRVLVVSHKATLRIIFCALLGMDVRLFRERIGQAVGALTRFEIGKKGPLLTMHGDVSYLPDDLRGLEAPEPRVTDDADDPIRRAIDAVWRIEAARLIAALARLVRDVGLAEELAQDALVAALEQWPASGVPRNAGAWLMNVAKRRAIDRVRREKVAERKLTELERDLDTAGAAEAVIDDDDAGPGAFGDDLLRLVFVACHPVLATEARVALTLRLVGGLTTAEIARAFLVSEPTIAQRIVRAKRTLADKGVPFEVPVGPERAARLESVLEVIYLVFNEGYAASSGDDWMRPELCEDALRLGRTLAALVPDEPEVHGLAALMEIQASRTGARVSPRGEPILLLDQNRARWDQLLIRRGLAALGLAEALAAGALGPYALQAAIAACHARARTADETDWRRIAELYATLAAVMPSPIVELNRAVAIAMADGPAAGLAHLEPLRREPALASYHLLPGVRGDLLAKLGRFDEAQAELERAALLTHNARERALMLERAAACARQALLPS